jgi:hypothetical protein
VGNIGEAIDCPALEDAGVQAVLFVPCDMAFSPGLYQRLDMVCGGSDGVVRYCGAESDKPLEAASMLIQKSIAFLGIICGGPSVGRGERL